MSVCPSPFIIRFWADSPGAAGNAEANAQATATFNAGGTSGNGHADATVDQATVTANIVILEPLQITKSFNPNPVAVNVSSTLTFASITRT